MHLRVQNLDLNMYDPTCAVQHWMTMAKRPRHALRRVPSVSKAAEPQASETVESAANMVTEEQLPQLPDMHDDMDDSYASDVSEEW